MRTLADPFPQSPYHAISNIVNIITEKKRIMVWVVLNLPAQLYIYKSPHTCVYTFGP